MVYRTKNWTICLCFPENRENVETFFPLVGVKKKSGISVSRSSPILQFSLTKRL